MLTDAEEQKLFNMITEIYHHLGLDGQKPISIIQVRVDAQKDVLKFQEKRRKRGHGFEETRP
ncbi:MAG: hypothetical protein ACLQBQ_07410 [Smithella sp.]